MEYTLENTTANHQCNKVRKMKQIADLFSEQTWSCISKGEHGEENGPEEAGGYCPA